MELVVYLAIAIFLLFLVFKYWYITLIIVTGGCIFYFVDKANKEEAQRQADEVARKAAEAAHLKCFKEEQREYQKQMIVFGEDAIQYFEKTPNYLIRAEKHLDQAEIDFSEGVFAPFWDSIENAAKSLGYFYDSINKIKDNSVKYSELSGKYEGAPPKFPLASESVAKLEVGTATSERMKVIVRSAQRNFQFATIYEQRKTNQILITGFTNLAQALDEMTWKITQSVGDLANSVDGMTSTLNTSMSAISSTISEITERASQHHNELMEGAKGQAVREGKALEMLDNIQRRRRPS